MEDFEKVCFIYMLELICPEILASWWSGARMACCAEVLMRNCQLWQRVRES